MRNAFLFASFVASIAGVVVACSSSDPDPAKPTVIDGGSLDGAIEAGEIDAGPWPSTVAVPLTHACGSSYHMPLQIGAGTYEVVLDTGSTTLAVASSLCTNCLDAGVPAVYTPNPDSDTHEFTDTAYVDTSRWTGEIVSDTVKVPGSKTGANVRFAAIQAQDGFFQVQEDCPNYGGQGILGLGPLTDLAPGTESVIDKLHQAGMPNTFAFQLCLDKGTLWFGGFDKGAGTGDPMYVPMFHIGLSRRGPAQVSYAINVADVQIGGASLGAATSNGPYVLDTGSSLNHLPSDVYNALVAKVTASDKWKDFAGDTPFFPNQCVFAPDGKTIEDIDALLPHVTVKLDGGVVLDLPPSGAYLEPQTQDGKLVLCPGVDGIGAGALPGSGEEAKAIFGDVMLRSYVTIFNRASVRIGFMPYKHGPDCK